LKNDRFTPKQGVADQTDITFFSVLHFLGKLGILWIAIDKLEGRVYAEKEKKVDLNPAICEEKASVALL
jgi:hypothetical protein